MLASAGTIETVAAAVEEHGLETLVVDPVRFPRGCLSRACLCLSVFGPCSLS